LDAKDIKVNRNSNAFQNLQNLIIEKKKETNKNIEIDEKKKEYIKKSLLMRSNKRSIDDSMNEVINDIIDSNHINKTNSEETYQIK